MSHISNLKMLFLIDLGMKEKKSVFPTTLEEFGYQFNKGL